MNKRCYITTPIYYANGWPHIGTTYTTLIADVLARSKRLLWYQVKFAVGTDENWQKMKETAIEEGKDVMQYLNEIEILFRNARDKLDISYTDYIRTTHPTHHRFVQEILEDALKKWVVYQWEYEWMYCLWCEGFKKESDLIDHDGKHVCPDHLKEPKKIKEKNRFFKLKEFENFLNDFYKQNSDFVFPDFRYNEVRSFVDQWLEDFSISREGSDFWIPLPESFKDPESVVYIRFDALYNYLTVCLYPQDFTRNWQSVSWDSNDISFWNEWEIIHTLWKDISRFHAIFWPAMLHSSGYKQPWKEIIHWFFTVDGQKMSKSLGNKIDPLDLYAEYWRDALVYYLFSDIKIWNDGDFSKDRLTVAKENVLKKWWGNLVSRVGKLCKKYEISKVDITDLSILDTFDQDWTLLDSELRKVFLELRNNNYLAHEVIASYIQNNDYMWYLRDRFSIVQNCNWYMQIKEPWVKIKDKDTKQEAINDLQLMLWLVKNLALISSPFLVEWFSRIQDIIQVQHIDRTTFQTFENEAECEVISKKFKTLFELKEFEVAFGEGYVY